MASQRLLTTGGFTLDLSAHNLIFNDQDITEGFVYHQVNNSRYPGQWMIPVRAFGVERDVVLDSGAGLNYIDKADIVAFAKHLDLEIVDGGGVATRFQPVGLCNRDVGLTLEFSQGQKVRIPKHLFWRPMANNTSICYSNFVAAGDDSADGGIWTFGMAFCEYRPMTSDVESLPPYC